MNWFNVLKEQKTITDLGIDFELPEKVESKKDKRDCCEEARIKYKEQYTIPFYLPEKLPTEEERVKYYDSAFEGYINGIDCEELKTYMNQYKGDGEFGWMGLILDEWEECENE